VIDNIYRRAIPAQKYLPEQHSGTTTSLFKGELEVFYWSFMQSSSHETDWHRSNATMACRQDGIRVLIVVFS